MARPRKHDKHLPRGMLRRRGTYYFVRDKWLNLGKDYGAALVKYAELVGTRPDVRTVRDAVWSYIEAGRTRKHKKPLAEATVEGYLHSAKRLLPVFGEMALEDVTPEMVSRYIIDTGTVGANRDKALLSAAYTYARIRGNFAGVDPTKKLQVRNHEEPRQRYVEDRELVALEAAASAKVRCITRFSYLTGMRQGDVLRVRLADIDDEGIHYTAGKNGARRVVLWSEDLKAVVAEANKLWRRFGREYLFESHPKGKHAGRGPGPYTTSGVRALWRRVRVKAGVADVRLHDLRRKAGSDVEEPEAQRLLGHADGKVTRRHYRARPERVKPVK